MRSLIQLHTRSLLRQHIGHPNSVPVRWSRIPPLPLRSPHLQQRLRSQGPPLPSVAVQSSHSSYVFVFLLACCSSALVYEYYYRTQDPASGTSAPAPPPDIEEFPLVQDERHPAYDKMPIPEGCLGNLTPQQEAKLCEFWVLTLKTFAVVDPDAAPTTPPTTAATPVQTPQKTPKQRGRIGSLFSRGGKHETEEAPGSPSSVKTVDQDDKYGQTAELQQILRTQSPEVLRATFWEMLKDDHPDSLMLRFLRARKWDVNKALAMMISTIDWRQKQMRVDDDIILNGEQGALVDSQGSDASAKKEGHDFLAQLRMGKSFIHGADKDGRPITYVRARLHRGGEQTERSLERFTVYVIEIARLTLRQPVETGCIVFDLTGFTLANMDYTPVKFMIKVFEANYPESLGVVLVHRAPWVFQGIWKIIKGWLDPVVAAKIHFTNSVEDMESFIPKSQIISDLGGDEQWEYKYIECVDDENSKMKDTATRDQLREERKKTVADFQTATFRWLTAAAKDNTGEVEKLGEEREELTRKLSDNYWQLDPYLRARSLYDRVGMIADGGKVDFYPQHTLKTTEKVNGNATVSEPAPAETATAANDDDGVD